MFITGKLVPGRVDKPRNGKRGSANLAAARNTGAMLGTESRSARTSLARPTFKDVDTIGNGLHLPGHIVAQLAARNTNLEIDLESPPADAAGSCTEDLPGIGAAPDLIGKIGAFVSGLHFPEQISRVMARPSDGDLVEILIVHDYDSHGEAIDVVREDFGATEADIPGAYFEFSYIESGQFAAKDYRGFVDVLACLR